MLVKGIYGRVGWEMGVAIGTRNLRSVDHAAHGTTHTSLFQTRILSDFRVTPP